MRRPPHYSFPPGRRSGTRIVGEGVAATGEKALEEVYAAVVLKSEATVEQLQAHCRDRLADFKVPKLIHVVREMPKGPTGKVQRRHMAAALAHRG